MHRMDPGSISVGTWLHHLLAVWPWLVTCPLWTLLFTFVRGNGQQESLSQDVLLTERVVGTHLCSLLPVWQGKGPGGFVREQLWQDRRCPVLAVQQAQCWVHYAPRPDLETCMWQHRTAPLIDEDAGMMKDKELAQDHAANTKWTRTQSQVWDGLQPTMATSSPDLDLGLNTAGQWNTWLRTVSAGGKSIFSHPNKGDFRSVAVPPHVLCLSKATPWAHIIAEFSPNTHCIWMKVRVSPWPYLGQLFPCMYAWDVSLN